MPTREQGLESRCLQRLSRRADWAASAHAEHYPGMKLGLAQALNYFTLQLLPLAQRQIETLPSKQQWLISAPPYIGIPSAANLLGWRLQRQLQQQYGDRIRRLDLRLPNTGLAIHNEAEFAAYYLYSRRSEAQRRAEKADLYANLDEVIQQAGPYRNQAILIVNDIRVTATQEKMMQASLQAQAPQAVSWLYIYEMDQALAEPCPDIEYDINHAGLQTAEDFARAIVQDDIEFTARCIGRLFSYDIAQFHALLRTLSREKCQLIKQLANSEGRFSGRYFADKMRVLTGLAREPRRQSTIPFDQPYQINCIEREQIAGPHYQIPVDDKHALFAEPLVNLADYGIAFESYHAISDASNPPYFQAIPGSRQEGWLRKTVVQKLVHVNQHLQPYGAELLILDAYRSLQCQQGLWAFFYERGRQTLADPSEGNCRNYALGYVRDPRAHDRSDARTWPIHITGSSVDVVLKDLATDELRDMGSRFEEIIDISKTDYFERALQAGHIQADDPRLLNRRLMDWAFTQEGFLNDPILYWHYDWGNQIWIKVKNALHGEAPDKAWYGLVDTPAWGVADASTLPPSDAKFYFL